MTQRTTIRNTRGLDEGDGLLQEDIAALQTAEQSGEAVMVDCESCTGYYDITMLDGREIPALSWWHLEGFTEPRESNY